MEYDIDIIHSHYALPHAAAALLAKEISRKYVIRIFKRVTELSELDLELWIIGEGPLRPEMTILARNLSVCDKIKYLGIRNIVGPLIAESDVFLLYGGL